MFSRPNRYEFDVTAWPRLSDQTRIVICAEPTGPHRGEAAIDFWVELRHPEMFDWDTRMAIPASVVVRRGHYFGTVPHVIEEIRGKKFGYKARNLMAMRTMLLAVAREEVIGLSAREMVWSIFHDRCVATREQWLMDAAPEWWKLVDPERGTTDADVSGGTLDVQGDSADPSPVEADR